MDNVDALSSSPEAHDEGFLCGNAFRNRKRNWCNDILKLKGETQ